MTDDPQPPAGRADEPAPDLGGDPQTLAETAGLSAENPSGLDPAVLALLASLGC